MNKVIALYKALTSGEKLLPSNTGFDWWENVYTSNSSVYDREFTRRYTDFLYYDFLEADTMANSKANFKADVLSILTLNQKKYAEMYRVFIVSDQDMPISYNYDMTETTGAQKTTTVKGQQTNTIGSHTDSIGTHTDQIGAETTTHNVAPFNTTTPQAESSDSTTGRSDIYGARSDTYGQRSDTEGQRTDTIDTDQFTLTRVGNIGVMTSSQIAEHLTDYFGEKFKFMLMVFEDICKQLLLIGD